MTPVAKVPGRFSLITCRNSNQEYTAEISPTKRRMEMSSFLLSTSYTFEKLQPDMEATVARRVTQADITAFADVTGDKNPLHLDPEYAATTIFKTPIAHGMLTAGYISAVFAMKLPGPGAIYVSQTLNFRAPVRAGDVVFTRVKVLELINVKRWARFECVCVVNEMIVLDGEAILKLP
jgi:3-hydroxybutyryl-CoA dehydratase